MLGDYARTALNIRQSQAQARSTPSVGKTHFALKMEWPLLLSPTRPKATRVEAPFA
jgi:hypothetical protein